jgi:hypothetical protein
MSPRIALLMMQKNERLLLDPWITYHRSLADPASIFVFDNGSTDPQTLAILETAEASGVSVNRRFNQQQDYFKCGLIFAETIKQLDNRDPHDFYFAMDCDEFLACDQAGRISCSLNDIDQVLARFANSRKVLTIPHKYVNSPYHPNRYSNITWCKKCFFAKGACASLEHGFHQGCSIAGSEELETGITYIEFHYKPYSEHLRLSGQKIEYLLPDLKRRTLFEYAKKKRSNHHAAVALLQSEYTYLRSFDKQTQTHTDSSLLQRFTELGIDSTALFDSSDNQNNLRRAMLLARHLQLQAWDAAVSLYYRYRSMGSAIKRLLRQ